MNTNKKALRSSSIFVASSADSFKNGWLKIENDSITGIAEPQWVPDDSWKQYQLGDKTVIPGFVDPHVHIEHTAHAIYAAVDCHTPPIKNITELIETLKQNVHLASKRGGWLIGQGGLFADRRFEDGRLPDKHDLDKASKDIPIAIRFGFHVTILNSKAIELALNAGLKEGEGGHIIYGEDGEPSGVIHELFQQLPIPPLSDDELKNAILYAIDSQLTKYGVTTFGEITNTPRDLIALDELIGESKVHQDVLAFLWAPGTRSLEKVTDLDDWSDIGAKPQHLKIKGIKIFADGGFSAAGAAVLKPYASGTLKDGKEYGTLVFTDDELLEILKKAENSNLQLIAHANGERAQIQLSLLAGNRKTNNSSLPVRLEHAGNVVTDWDTLTHWKTGRIIPIAQAGFIWTMGSFIPEYLGDYSLGGMFPFKSLLERGWHIASSSDGAASEMAQFNPLFGIARSIDRQGYAGPVNTKEAISLGQGLLMHTNYAAEALGVSASVGTLEAGKKADVVVFSQNLETVPVSKLADTKIHLLMKEGTIISDGSEI